MNRIKITEQYLNKIYGDDRSPLEATDPEFAAIKERLIYGEIYAEEKLSPRLRELIILAVATTNQTMREIQQHTRAALSYGVPLTEIKEAVYHCAPYIGLGKAEAMIEAINQILIELDVALPLPGQGTVTESRRLADGIAVQRSIFGDSIDVMRAATPDNQKNIQDYLSAYCFGDFYTRAGLDTPTRELLTFAILAALGGCEPQLEAHVRGNVTVGNEKDTLLATLTICLPYIGFPRTLNALACVNEMLPEIKK